jgi:predicted transcriptional regulator
MSAVFETLANALYDLVKSPDAEYEEEEEEEEEHQDIAVQAPKNLIECFDEIESEFQQLQTAVKELRQSYSNVSQKLDVAIKSCIILLCSLAVTHSVCSLVSTRKSSRLCRCQ